jgi:transposase
MATMLEQQVEELKKSNQAKDARIVSLSEKNASQAAKIQHLQFELMMALHRLWSRSSEKFQPQGPLLFDELAPQSPPVEEEPAQEQETKNPSKRGRKALSSKLPRVEHPHDMDEADRMCRCGRCMVKIGEDYSEKLAMDPARFWVERHIWSKYACPNANCPCTVDGSRPGVVTAKEPLPLIPRSIVTAGLLAHIWTAKFCDHLPFYRQEAGFQRVEVEISRQDMTNWTMKVSLHFEPLMELIEAAIREGPVIQMDETPVTVLELNKTGHSGKGYMWLARGGTRQKKAVRYRFAPGRGNEHAKAFLKNFPGYLQSDAMAAYDVVAQDGLVTQVGCWAHARRKFFEAQKVAPSELTKDAIGRIKKLYELEDQCRERAKREGLDDQAFMKLRKATIKPLLEELKKWLNATAAETLPSGPAGKALAYTIGQWNKLERFLDHPWLTPDNNRAENCIRPFVVGRKNWLFHGNEEGAAASCRIYTLIETAKMNGLEPWAYLKELLEKLPEVRVSGDWESLLPWNLATGKI